MRKVVLASESPRRRELLSSLEVNYITCSSAIEEVFNPSLPIEEAIQDVAFQKANAVVSQFPNDVIIGADTIVVYEGQILGKPKDDEDAKQMLQMLSGKTHYVLTGVAILSEGKKETFVEKTEVVFYELEEQLIDSYIATKEPRDKAGAYGIQGKGCILVKEIRGDYFNVVGLPLATLFRKLRTLE